MTAPRLSRLHKRLLWWLCADEQRTGGVITSHHQELVQAVPSAKGNSSHSLRQLETRDLLRIGRALGGQAAYVTLTPAGRQKASQLERSYDQEIIIGGTRTCNHIVCHTSPRHL
jgi:hypothetical protein